MGAIKQAYDISSDDNVELYLTWMPAGNQVDIAIYIHNIPGGKKRQEYDILFAKLPYYTQRTYQFQEVGGDHPDSHTEYFEYTIEGPPQRVIADLIEVGGGVSKADAIAL